MKFGARIAAWLACSALLFSSHALAQGRLLVAPVRPVTNTYFGIKITDPYRYMEDLKSPEVRRWMKAQADYTTAALGRIPGRKALLADIVKYDNSEPALVHTVTRMEGPRYFYLKALAGQNIANLYMRQGLGGREKLLVDTRLYNGPRGEPAAINYYVPSPDGRYVAYGISLGGSENATIRVLDIQTGKNLPVRIDRARFGGVSWLPDSSGFLYNRMQKLGPGVSSSQTELKSKVYLHILGEPLGKDVAVFGYGLSPDVSVLPIDMPYVTVQPGTDYALGVLYHGVQNEVTMYDAPLSAIGKPDIPWKKICDTGADVTDFALHGNDVFLLTHKDAPRFQLIETSLAHPDLADARLIVPEGPGVLSSPVASSDAVYLQDLAGGVYSILRIPYGGSVSRLPLPFQGYAVLYPSDPRLPGALIFMTSWVKGRRVLEYDPATNKVDLTGLQPSGPYDNLSDLTSEELEAPSWDGTLVPLSVVYRKGLRRDGSNPTIIEAYGAYGITIDPTFNPMRLAALDRGAIFAVCHVRGGGEYGNAWYKAGYKLTKPNTWRDLIGCAKYLIAHKYTSASKLGIIGASAGGITIGRAITERPDLFAAAMIEVGLTNPVRAQDSANGLVNVPEFGSVDTQAGFEDLYAMDAYLHVRNGVPYPAVMLTTGMNDPRVAPWMPAKMAARLQAATSSGKPVLLRVNYQGGHGFGATRKQEEDLYADFLSFFFWQFGMPRFQPNHP
ncbi:MAG TPA: prolyl oligopeptidase family serine peptidase [Candidatus Dormibacteraeota bacterium]|nr:prolyl oligopeptidase family serine peptidase [Candidatus Dormibacteraeota bacterium]